MSGRCKKHRILSRLWLSWVSSVPSKHRLLLVGVVNPPLSGTKKEPKPKLLSSDISGVVGVFHMRGGAQKFGMSLKTREIKLFWRDIPGFCWDIPAVPEKLEKNVCVQFLTPTLLKDAREQAAQLRAAQVASTALLQKRISELEAEAFRDNQCGCQCYVVSSFP